MASFKQVLLPKKLNFNSSESISQFFVWRNLILICLSKFFFLVALFGINGIQSSVLKEGGIGLASLATSFAVQLSTSLILPQILINKIKFKWALVLSYFLQLFYIGFNAYPKWYTYLPGKLKHLY